jgi:uncharacterized protein DUF5666
VRYTVVANASTTSREVTLTVRNSTHRVTQSGIPTGDIKLDGTVSGLSGSCPALRFTVLGIPVTTDNKTDFRRGNCNEVRNGTDVSVEGVWQSGAILAKRVELGR